jgi:hypothetical protein
MSLTTFALLALFVAAASTFVSELVAWQTETSRELLAQWAHSHGVTLMNVERRWIATGPFPISGALDQPTFRVVARASNGPERTAWVRCGSFPFGVIFDPTIEARWS